MKGECDFTLAKSVGVSVDRFPETKEEAQRIEEALEKELEKLTLDEHEKILFDIHGITPTEDEEPSMVDAKLKELEARLAETSTGSTIGENKEAYNLACQKNPTYVGSRGFRLMFLRCVKFDVESAAEMIVKHFDVKLYLFGDGDVLARDVRQSDLSEKDRVILESGSCQVLPTRDAAGRAIVLITSATIGEYPKDGWDDASEFRAFWYIWMTIVKDEETQKNGSIFLIMNLNGYKVSVENMDGISKIEAIIPNRIAGGHYCYNDPALRPYVVGFQLFVSEDDRYRLRTHCGSRAEIDFALQTFGIPAQESPVRDDGSCSVTAHREWLSMLRIQEEKEASALANGEILEEFIVIPHRFDVLFGKDSSTRDHTGTRRALHVVEMHFEEYERLGKYQKTDVAEKIISIIHASGGRFLRQDDEGAWREVPGVEARKKIAHWFRHARTKRIKQQEEESLSSSSSTKETSTLSPRYSDTEETNDRPAKRVTPIASPVDSFLTDEHGLR